MTCPRCGRKSKKQFKNYCSEVHMILSGDKKGELQRLFCAVCDRPIYRMPSKVPKKGKPVCVRCSKNQGENHGNFKGARYKDPAGYVHILVKGRYKLEHRHTWSRFNRACLLPWQPNHIHHINFIKDYNDPNNLLLLSDREHLRVHQYIRAGRYMDAYEIMHKRAQEQYFYPSEVKRFKQKVKQGTLYTKEKKTS